MLFFHTGMIAAAQGDPTAARSNLQQALTINPYFSLLEVEVAKATLAKLK